MHPSLALDACTTSTPTIRIISLIQRLNIAIDLAFAVEYLHRHCEPPMVHGDLKPCNVLLDHDMVAHVGDFGLSKFLYDLPHAHETQSSSIGIRGTVGYIAPGNYFTSFV